MIAQWSQGSLLIALALVAIASLVLGMGLPVTAAYIVLSNLSAPALAGMLADGIILQQLVAGVSDPAVIAMFTLVDAELPELLHLAVFALFGLYAFNALLQRYAERPLNDDRDQSSDSM